MLTRTLDADEFIRILIESLVNAVTSEAVAVCDNALRDTGHGEFSQHIEWLILQLKSKVQELRTTAALAINTHFVKSLEALRGSHQASKVINMI